MEITAKILTKEQMIKGLIVDEPDDHTVVLRHGEHIIGRYNSNRVLITELRQDADNYLNGIEFTKQ